MKLVPKLVTAVLVGVLSVVFASAFAQFRRDVVHYDVTTRRAHRIIGLTAAAAIASPHPGRIDPAEVIQRVDATRENVRIRYVSFTPGAPPDWAPVRGARSPPPEETLEQHVVELDEDGVATPHLLTYARAPTLGHPNGAVELVESLAPRSAYVKGHAAMLLVSSLVMVAVCGVIAVFISTRMVGQPVSRLIAATRRIGAGDLEPDLGDFAGDELGQLAAAVAEMSADLRKARRRAESEVEARVRALEQLRHAERLATLGQLASVLAHEIGTPLNVIAGNAKLVATGRVVGGSAAEACRVIGAQSERMVRLVRRILDYARRKPGRRAPFSIGDVVESAVEMLRPLAGERSLTLRYAGPTEPLWLFGDPTQVQQAVTNVAMNALQASPTGETVQLSVEASSSDGAADTPSERVVDVKIRDAGAGIPAELMARIFDPFFTTKPSGEGTGLGLSVVQEILQEHGGRVLVDSAPGEGTSVILRFPTGTAPVPAESA